MQDVSFDWIDYYREFAHVLLQYKNKRAELVQLIPLIYEKSGLDMPTLENGELQDIDPFTIYGFFNKSIKEENRKRILMAIKEIFSIQAAIPLVFNSVPFLNNRNAIYYHFLPDRGAEDIDDLWELFDAAICYADESTYDKQRQVEQYFDRVINKKGNANSKVTMGLYWLAPDVFLNLDSRNTWYIYESQKIPAEFVASLPDVDPKISAKKYFQIISKVRQYLASTKGDIKNFEMLSYEAWRYSTEVNENEGAQAEETSGNQDLEKLDVDEKTPHYWLYFPGLSDSHWNDSYNEGIMGLGWKGLGDLRLYASKTEIKDKICELKTEDKQYLDDVNANWQFVNEMNPGDIIFVKNDMHQIIGRGIVTSEYQFDANREVYQSIRAVNWTDYGAWNYQDEQAPMKTLTDITPYIELVQNLKALFPQEKDKDNTLSNLAYEVYDEESFLKDVYMNRKEYHTLVGILTRKKNIILQGPPGVGKTYAAKRLAYSIMGEKDISRVAMIQFHQSYSYEDFIMGYRPMENGFKLQHGVFYDFCKKAENDSENAYFFIIDEINRGNLSKIFGELFMMLEADKRNIDLRLLYANEMFHVPTNLYIIGTMNTADRSLALLDYALRRRFAFFDLHPGFETAGFQNYMSDKAKLHQLVDVVKQLNQTITGDDALGKGFCIGHSYFSNLCSDDTDELSQIVEYELIPLLQEYWFDDSSNVQNWADRLRGVLL